MPPSADTPLISDVEEGQAVNNNQDVLISLLEARRDHSQAQGRSHTCKPGERHVRSPADPSGPQHRQLFCKTHTVSTKCILCPVAPDCPAHDHEVAPIKPKPFRIRDFSKQQAMVLIALALGNFLCFCSMSILAPFYPKEAHKIGMGVSLSGCVFSFYALVVSVTAPVLGKILPKVGAKSLYIWGLALAAISNFLFGLLPHTHDYTLFTTMSFFVRGLEALGASAFSTSSFVFVVETFPDNISTILGVMETVIGLGMSVGPAIGGVLYSMGGFGLPFYILGGIMLLVVPLDIWILPSASAEANNKSSGSLWKLIKIPAVFVVCIIIAVSSNVWSFLDPVLEPHLEIFSLTSREVGFVFLLFSTVYAVFSLFWGWLADKVDNHWSMMAVGLAVSTASLLVLGPTPYFTTQPNKLWVDLVALCVLGVSVALTLMPTYQAILNFALENGHKRQISTYSMVAGTWSCMYSFGEMVGPTVGGVMLDSYGFATLTTVMAYSTFLMFLLCILFFTCRHMCNGDMKNDEFAAKKPFLEHYCFYSGVCNEKCVMTIVPPTVPSYA